MIDLHYWPTANGKKVTILLEETGLDYRIIPVNISRGDQFSPEFLKLNPNHRMPVIVDQTPAAGGPPLVVFESGAILVYLAEKAGMFWPTDLHARFATLQWLMWQAANFGPKLGEYNHFARLAGEYGDQSYALRRYGDEANRLYGVLNWGLAGRPFLAGDDYGLADIAVYPWAANWHRHGQDLGEFRHVGPWLERVGARPAVRRGMAVREDLFVDPATLTADERQRYRRILLNQRAIPLPADMAPPDP